MEKIAIVGFGYAGYSALKALRHAGSKAGVDVYLDGSDPPANPMLTTYYIADKIGYEGIFPFGGLAEIEKEFNATAHRNKPVVSINTDTLELVFEDGSKAAYDQILIATGASPFLPPIEGTLPPHKGFCLRTPADAMALKQVLQERDVRSAIVIGSSMVGIKVAEALFNAGVAVTLADMADQMFPLAAFPGVAAEIEARLVSNGMKLRLGYGLTGVEESGSGIVASFADGGRESADMIILCVGTKANTDLVRASAMDIGRAIRVNEHMQTSVPGIYAAGDCCEGANIQTGQHQVIGLWANAAYQGNTAGNMMAGARDSFDGNIPHNITHFMDMDFVSIGDNRAQGERIAAGDLKGGLYIEMTLSGGRPVCINILGDHSVSGVLKSHMADMYSGRSTPLPPALTGLLSRYGVPEDILAILEGGRQNVK